MNKDELINVHRFINLGFRWLHYIHYTPKSYSTSHWGFMTDNFKNPSVDFYIGKHVFVFTLRRKD